MGNITTAVVGVGALGRHHLRWYSQLPDSDLVGLYDIDRDKAAGPLRVRGRRPGDRFRPLGAAGEKKLKKFFIDRKVPRHLRESIPLVVAADGAIAWVVGHRIADGFKLSGHDRAILQLKAACVVPSRGAEGPTIRSQR